jgi:glycogen phosphorylase
LPPPQSLQRLTDRPEVKAWGAAILAKLTYSLGKGASAASERDWFTATALAVREEIVEHWTRSTASATPGGKRVYYLSIEFLIGRLLYDALINLGLLDTVREALSGFDVDFERIREFEAEPGLGNGGLGRLAACFLDSMSALKISALGYGIRYRFGLFKQRFVDGMQEELPDDWLAMGNPWEIERPEIAYPISFGGVIEYVGEDTARGIWYPAETVLAVAYETPVVGWRGEHVNALRLWSSRRSDFAAVGDHHRGVLHGASAASSRPETLSDSLYPSDATPAGKELRLRQEYFFTAASLQDIVRQHLRRNESLASLPSKVAIQLNDTHPAIAVAELMRILIDEHEFSWPDAWRITTGTLNYTNHTLLPEALERWPVELMNRLLPRHLQIIYLINWLHLKELADRGFGDPGSLAAASLIDEGGGKSVRMGHLAFVGSHRINGVSALHTELMRDTVFGGLRQVAEGRIVNKTNGVSFRRWLFGANPGLTSLLADAVGGRLFDDVDLLGGVGWFADDASFVERFARIRRDNKLKLAQTLRTLTGVQVDPSAMFDMHIKRIHEYKRQFLNILETVALWQAIRARPHADWTPRVKIFAGKAAADYARAKLIIKFAHDVGRVINSDPVVGDRLKLVFLPNYGVSLAEQLVPAADVSEQISTAGMEASGTGNMKLALNGVLTIGTLDGANVEICQHVGAENVFIFGLKADEVAERRRIRFHGREAVEQSAALAAVVGEVAAGRFSANEPRFESLVNALLDYDHFMVAADFDAYWETQRALDALWNQPADWWRASILNTARMGWFSSDRTIREYAGEIWGIDIRPGGRQ